MSARAFIGYLILFHFIRWCASLWELSILYFSLFTTFRVPAYVYVRFFKDRTDNLGPHPGSCFSIWHRTYFFGCFLLCIYCSGLGTYVDVISKLFRNTRFSWPTSFALPLQLQICGITLFYTILLRYVDEFPYVPMFSRRVFCEIF